MKNLKPALLTALIFAATGPLAGALAYAVWGFSLLDDTPTIVDAIFGAIWMIPFGYVIGLVPAALTGLIVGILARRYSAAVYVGLSAVVGALVMAAFSALTASPAGVTDGVLNLAALGAGAGALSGIVSRALVRSGRARPDESRSSPA